MAQRHCAVVHHCVFSMDRYTRLAVHMARVDDGVGVGIRLGLGLIIVLVVQLC